MDIELTDFFNIQQLEEVEKNKTKDIKTNNNVVEQIEEITNKKKHKNRCKECNKKIKMMSFECKCGNFYCSKHRSNFDHKCSYDWKQDKLNELIKNNPKVSTDKLNRI